MVAVAVGVLPAPAVEVGAKAGLRLGWALIELGARSALTAARAGAAARPATGGAFTLAAGSVAGCALLGGGGLRGGPCAGLELGQLRARAVGVSRSTPRAAWWLAASAGAGLSWETARRLAVSLRLDGLVPLERPQFEIDNVGPVFRTAALCGRIAVGLDLRFR
jgi:hypothetical protein